MTTDLDPTETNEWLAALQDVLQQDGTDRAQFLLQTLANSLGTNISGGANIGTTAYRNTISVAAQPQYPGDLALERRIRSIIRWNAAVIVLRASAKNLELGGHIGSFASSASLYDIGFNHFWRAPHGEHPGDMLFIQGHTSPGMYARSFLEGRFTSEHLDNFRQEISGKGLSSYPHPWLMPDYWQFPTVSMGLGPMQAIYHARYTKYLQARSLVPQHDQKFWCFCGDGEMDEPESLGAISVAAREKLDNLIFVINCNLQRLDGPVRGNGKIIQEMESVFKGAGWNVIKVVWGSDWDELLAEDDDGLLQKLMDETVDGEYQNCNAKGGQYIREKFFGKYPELLDRIADYSDEQLWQMKRGGHDSLKLYAAYAAAMTHQGQPTVILAKTVKGYGLGTAGEGLNTAHNTKKMAMEQVKAFRDRFDIPVSDKDIENLPFYRPADNSPEMQYLQERRKQLQGYLPQRRSKAQQKLQVPALDDFSSFFAGSGERNISTTMAFVRIITQLCKDKNIGKQVVPIVPDESRTFGMEGLFRQFGIYAPEGQKYTPVDSEQVMFYKESKDGQILQEGINEAGAFCSWLASATSYSVHNKITIPFYIYYSMFGFQRIGDFAWAAGDSRARGFLIGATSGRTTLNGEGLQHEDGHSHIMANLIPNCKTYDPTFGYELAVIIQHGLQEMVAEQKDLFYYITTMNENYHHPEMPKDAVEGIIKGMYQLQKTGTKRKLQVQLLGSGTILREVMAAAEILDQEHNVGATVWSATSFNELARDGQACERWSMFNPTSKAKVPYVTTCLQSSKGPVIAATDYIRAYVDQIRYYVPGTFIALGTDGYGRSDSRENLRRFFEVDRYSIVIGCLRALVEEGNLKPDAVVAAMKKYDISPDKINPMDL